MLAGVRALAQGAHAVRVVDGSPDGTRDRRGHFTRRALHAIIALRDVESKLQRVASDTQVHTGEIARRQCVGDIHLRGSDREDRVDQRLEARELATHLRRGVWRIVRGIGGVEGHGVRLLYLPRSLMFFGLLSHRVARLFSRVTVLADVCRIERRTC